MVRVSAWCAAAVMTLAGGSMTMAQLEASLQEGVKVEADRPVNGGAETQTVNVNGAMLPLTFAEQRDNGDTVYQLIPGDHPHRDKVGAMEFVITPRVRVELAPGVDPSVLSRGYGAGFDNLRTYNGRRFVTFVAATGADAIAMADRMRADARLLHADLLVRGQRQPMGGGGPIPTQFGDRQITDTDFPFQWHLFNDGFFENAVAGNDIDIAPAWNAGFFGLGQTVLVVDDGIQTDHPDLAPNFSINGSFDSFFETPNPVHKVFGEGHGTACAGLIAAKDEGRGTVGVAPDATLTAYRVDFNGSTAEDFEAAHTFAQEINGITSNSYGISGPGLQTVVAQLPVSELSAFEDGIANGRGGLGTIYVKAGGNDRGFTIEGEEFARDDASYDGFANLRFTISVAASDTRGIFSSFSEPGGVHLVNAPSSSFPIDEGDPMNPDDDMPIFQQGIVTTDVESPVAGPGDIPGSITTGSFGGTSASCPIVSGVVALMLEANPNLTWRDVQWILAETADQTDPGDAGWTQVRDASVFDANRPVFYNNNYGFGRVNAGNAVRLAEVWNNVPVEIEETYDTNIRNPVAIPGPQPTPFGPIERPVVFTFDVDDSEIDEVQHVEFLLDLTHARTGELRITLTSPDGVEHLIRSRDTDFGSGYRYTFTAVKYLGNDIDGLWTLRVIDEEVNPGNPDNPNGFITDATLNFYGIESRPLNADCNEDGIEDAYQIALLEEFTDCDNDGVIDGCQIAIDPLGVDFDGNNELDTCQIARDPDTFDCDGNNILDAITLTESIYFDCNNNNRLDSCEIAVDDNLDMNLNGYFDSCEPEDLVDLNGTNQTADFTTINLGNDFGSHCGITAGGDDFVIPVTITGPNRLTATLSSGLGANAVLALREASELRGIEPATPVPGDCLVATAGPAGIKVLESGLLQAGTYFLVVDATAGASDYTLDVEFFSDGFATCVGDVNGDGVINLGDFGGFAAAFGSVLGDANYNSTVDFDADGDIDLGDFGGFASVFGSSCGD